jgi:hypothetical protein
MLVFDISASRSEGTKKGWKLPSLANWLTPKYNGPADELNPPSGVNLPSNWKKDFATYVYDFPELQALKKQLNLAKQKINPISADPQKREAYDRIVDMVRAHDELRGKHGLLAKEYGAEIVTNAWLKMFEMMMFLNPILNKLQKARGSKESAKEPPKAEKVEDLDELDTETPEVKTHPIQKEDNGRKLFSFHFAEAPGNFMLAINHYLRTNYQNIEWEWLANSYRDLYSHSSDGSDEGRNTHYLPDQYGLIAHYPDRWMFGADGDGDITSPANIRSFVQDVDKRFGGTLHFMTSDVKYVPQEVNFDEEEKINLPVHLGHLLCALLPLSKGGIMILKEFTLFEGPSVALVYLMTSCFDQLLIIKPETSRPGNSEIYIVGIGYKKNLSSLQIEKLLNIMNYIRFLNTEAGSPSIFRKEDIPADFVSRLTEIEAKLVKSQIQNLERNLELFKTYYGKPYKQIQSDLQELRMKKAQEWIKKTKIKKLDPRYKIGTVAVHESFNRRPGRFPPRWKKGAEEESELPDQS